jgi:hypothetical protein
MLKYNTKRNVTFYTDKVGAGGVASDMCSGAVVGRDTDSSEVFVVFLNPSLKYVSATFNEAMSSFHGISSS